MSWVHQRLVARLAWQSAVTAVFVIVALQLVDLRELSRAIADADWRWVFLALPVYTAAKYIDSWRWRYLLRGVAPLPQRALFGAFLIGNMVNNALPLRAGDVAKIQVLASRYGAPRAALAASVFIVEATLDGVVFVAFLVGALLFLELGDIAARGVVIVALAAAAGLAAAMFLTSALSGGWVVRLFPARGRTALAGRFGALLAGLYALRTWRRAAVAVSLSVPAWLVEASMFALFGRAFGLGLDYPTFIATMIAANLAVAIPLALWNFGPYEALVSGVLVAAGVDQPLALSFAVAVHLASSLWIQATGLVAFWALGVSPRDLSQLHARSPMVAPRRGTPRGSPP